MRGTASEETLQSKEASTCLEATHKARVCAYRTDSRRFVYPLFKEAVQTWRQQISYFGVGSKHKNTIVEHSINELTLCSQTLLLHTSRLWPKAMITMMCPFSFKTEYQRYKSWIWMCIEIHRRRSLQAWISKISEQTNTPEVSPSSYYNPPFREDRQVWPNGNHGWGPKYILDTRHSPQGQCTYY